MLESTDKLRKLADECYTFNDCSDKLMVIADEIEREIAGRYMELPVDADGVPIHVGDELCGYGRLNGGVTVSSVTGWGGVIVTDKGMTCNPAKDGLLWDGQECHHVKPRTIEDVLEEFLIEFDDWDWNTGGNDRDNARKQLFAKYADELRNMGVGE